MNEAETRAELIDPALRSAGWGVDDGSRVRREVIAPGRLIGGGHRGKQDIADYVLIHRGQKLAVIEAKKRSLPETEGLGQAKRYAERLQARFAYSTNGAGIYRVDMHTGEEGPVSAFPAPDELWTETFEAPSPWREPKRQPPRRASRLRASVRSGSGREPREAGLACSRGRFGTWERGGMPNTKFPRALITHQAAG